MQVRTLGSPGGQVRRLTRGASSDVHTYTSVSIVGRTKEEAEQTRQEIFPAGRRIFSEKGFAAARMSDVAQAAGVTRGAID